MSVSEHRGGRLAFPVVLVAGVLSSLAFPPAGWWPVAFVGLVPLLWCLRGARLGRAAMLGLCYGIGLYGASLYWIALFGAMAWTALVVLCAASTAVFAVVAIVLTRGARPILDAVVLAAAWTAVDWLRGMWPLGGFTWASLGISQVADRTLLPLASVTAVWGVTFVVVLVNAAIVELLAHNGRRTHRVALAIFAAAAVVTPAAIPIALPAAQALRVGVVQIDVRVPPGTSTVDEDLIVAGRSIALHKSLIGDPSLDLVVWGEGALDPAALVDPPTRTAVRSSIADVGVPTTVGAVVNDPDGSQSTSVLAFDAQGQIVGRYDKVHLVPFGEYVPWRSRLRWIGALRQIPVDRTPGESVHTLAQPGVPPYGTPICFENAFPLLTRAFVQAGATFLVVPVNNASYRFTAAAAQHLQMSQMRAVETGRWVVDAGVAGISAFIDPQGSVASRTELFRTGILRGDVVPSTAVTPYVRYGDVVPVACVIGCCLAMLAPPRRRTHARPTPGPLPRPARALAILPTYDERDTIVSVIEGVTATPGVDVLVVDDSSPDGTGEIARAIAAVDPRVRLLSRSTKSGLSTAYLEGFHVALTEGYDLAIEMDSDLSHDPAELPVLLEAADRHDLVVGSRYIPGGSVTDWSRSRVALSRAGNLYARFMLGLPIADATSGYRVYRRTLLEDLVRRPVAADGYGFQIELVWRSHMLGYDVGEAPITFRERRYGASKISRSIVAEALWKVTGWGLDMRVRPQRQT